MKKVTFSKWDSADYLKSEQDIAAYLNAVFEDHSDDPAFIVKALGNVARARGMTRIARKTGLTREGLYTALSGDGNPSFATVMKVVGALGVQLHTQQA
jgi:probable addiction module antidote protein